MEIRSVLSDITDRQEEGTLLRTAKYHPLRTDSQKFAHLTYDWNPIHQHLPDSQEAIAPGFMHTTAGISLLSDLMKKNNISASPHWKHSADMRGAVVTGKPYSIETRLNAAQKTAETNFFDEKKNKVFILTSTNHAEKEMPSIDAHFVHDEHIVLADELLLANFGNIMNLDRLCNPLYALARASSIVFNAIDAKKIQNPSHEVMSMYKKQDIALDMHALETGGNSIRLELYLSEPEKFGIVGAAMDMHVIGKNIKEETAYIVSAPLAFSDKKRMMKILQRSLR